MDEKTRNHVSTGCSYCRGLGCDECLGIPTFLKRTTFDNADAAYPSQWTHDDYVASLPLWKVVVSGDTADNAFGNLFSDDNFFRIHRQSPIVVYARMEEYDALELASTDGFEVTRARADWHI